MERPNPSLLRELYAQKICGKSDLVLTAKLTIYDMYKTHNLKPCAEIVHLEETVLWLVPAITHSKLYRITHA